MFEYYKGNELKMRSEADFLNVNTGSLKAEFLKVNKHARKDGNFAVYPSTAMNNPDGE